MRSRRVSSSSVLPTSARLSSSLSSSCESSALHGALGFGSVSGSGSVGHQGALTTVLEHTRAAHYGENFVR